MAIEDFYEKPPIFTEEQERIYWLGYNNALKNINEKIAKIPNRLILPKIEGDLRITLNDNNQWVVGYYSFMNIEYCAATNTTLEECLDELIKFFSEPNWQNHFKDLGYF